MWNRGMGFVLHERTSLPGTGGPKCCPLTLRGLRPSHLTLNQSLGPKVDSQWVGHRELQCWVDFVL